MNKLIGIIPAAGHSSRLFPYNGGKELLPVGTQRILINGKDQERPKIVSQYIIEAMAKAGVKKIIIVTRPEKHKLMSLYLDGGMYGVHISYVIQNPISMAHSIDFTYEWIKSSTVVFGMPDTITLPSSSVGQLVERHKNSEAILSLGLFKTDKPQKFGMIKTDKNSNVIYHEDKPANAAANYMWGIAVWEPYFTKLLHEYIQKKPLSDKEITLGDVFDIMLKKRKTCKAYPIKKGKYYDIGTYDDYKRAILDL